MAAEYIYIYIHAIKIMDQWRIESFFFFVTQQKKNCITNFTSFRSIYVKIYRGDVLIWRIKVEIRNYRIEFMWISSFRHKCIFTIDRYMKYFVKIFSRKRPKYHHTFRSVQKIEFLKKNFKDLTKQIDFKIQIFIFTRSKRFPNNPLN